MRRELPGGFELDDDRERIDVDAVHDFVANHSYWANGRPHETVERLVRESARVVGLYHDGRQIGFARTVSDGASLAYLADVYVLPDYRGQGLGVELVRESVESGPYKTCAGCCTPPTPTRCTGSSASGNRGSVCSNGIGADRCGQPLR